MTTAAGKPDFRSQNVWRECCSKEDKLRLKWFLKNQEDIIKLSEEQPADPNLRNLRKQAEQDRVNLYRNRKLFVLRKPDPLPDIQIERIQSEMKPVHPKIRKILYGTDGRNRLDYFKERLKLIPEEKYYSPMATSYDYGWHMFYYAKYHPSKEKYGHVQTMNTTFYRRCGVFEKVDPKAFEPICQ